MATRWLATADATLAGAAPAGPAAATEPSTSAPDATTAAPRRAAPATPGSRPRRRRELPLLELSLAIVILEILSVGVPDVALIRLPGRRPVTCRAPQVAMPGCAADTCTAYESGRSIT